MAEVFFEEGLRFERQPNGGACCNQKSEVHVSGPKIHRRAMFLRLPTLYEISVELIETCFHDTSAPLTARILPVFQT